MMLSMPVNFILIKADTGAGEALKNVNPGAVEAVENVGPLKRKRSKSMDDDILELEHLDLINDISSRQKVYQLRYFKRTIFNREIIMKEDGSIILGQFYMENQLSKPRTNTEYQDGKDIVCLILATSPIVSPPPLGKY
jgi:hypothetical protein